MRFKSTFLAAILFFSWLQAVSQDSTMWIAFEAGVDIFACESLHDNYIRADNANLNGFPRPTISSYLNKAFAGVKVEKKTPNESFRFSTGLRFTHLSSSIEKRDIPAYFYFRLRQTGTTTEYLRVKELQETSNYLGIPVEASWFLRRGGTFYLTAGAEWSYQLATKTDVEFHDEAMISYTSAIREVVGEPANWYASFYVGAGLMLGRNEPRFSIGITLPVITNSVSRLNMSAGGGGFQMQYRIPFKHNRT